LLSNTAVRQVHCLVRAEDNKKARKRILAALIQRFILPTPQASLEKLQSLAAKVDEKNLGLGEEMYEKLKQSSSIIIHVSHASCNVDPGMRCADKR
jgi:thioester reductase-like protein